MHRNLVGDVRVFESEAGGAATSLVQAVHKEAYFAEMIDLTDQGARISRSFALLT